MVSRVRMRQSALASKPDADLDLATIERQDAERAPEEPSEPRDPAVLAAARMLVDALDRPSAAADAIARVGAVVIIKSPSLLWSPYLLRAYPDVVGGFWERMRLTYVPSSTCPDRWSDRGGKPSWALRTKCGDNLDEKDILERAWMGEGVVVVTDDLAWVPQSVRGAADVILGVEAPGAGALLAASSVCGDGPYEWQHADPTGSTPGMVRSAFRNGALVADCQARMLRMLSANVAAAPVAMKASRWTLATLHGLGAVTSFARDLVDDMASWRAGTIGWDSVAPGAMVVGPPGVGKTTIARAVAEAASLRFLPSSFADWQTKGRDGRIDDCVRQMRLLFDEAAKEPTLVFLDELDSLPCRNDGNINDNWWTPVINALLECLDGAGRRGNVIVVGAANSVDRMDPALLRAGRLDRILQVPLPDRQSLEKIIREHVPELTSADARVLARRMAGKTGADVAQVARDARRVARRENRPVALGDLLAGIVADVRGTWERRLAALHEAGHAVAAEAIRPGSLLTATLADNERRGGGITVQPSPGVQTMEYIESRCIVGLSGRAAEQVVTGGITSAAGGSRFSDLAVVSAELVRARMALGLVDGMVWHGELTADRAARMLLEMPELSAWVDGRTAALYEQALALIGDRVAQVEAVADALMSQEALDGDEVRAVIGRAAA